jgi:hypothetical protein
MGNRSSPARARESLSMSRPQGCSGAAAYHRRGEVGYSS